MAEPTPTTQPETDTVRPDHHGPSVGHPDAKPPRRWRRRLLRLVILLVLLVLVLVVTGPMLLSTGPGSRVLLWAVNKQVDGTVSAQKVRVAWFSGLSVDGAAYTSADGMHNVTVGKISAPDATLWGLLTGDRQFGVVNVRDLHGITTEPEPGSMWRKDELEGPRTSAGDRPEQDRESWAAGLSLELKVEGLSWRYQAADLVPVDVVSSGLKLNVPGDGEVRLRSDGAVTQGDESGKFVVDITAHDLLDTYGQLQALQAQYEFDVSLQQVPVDALSRFVAGRRYRNAALAHLLSTPDRVSSLLGGRWLAVDFDAAGQLNQIDATLRIYSDRLNADLVMARDEHGLFASPESKLSLEMTREALAAHFPNTTLTMDESVTFVVEKPELVMPRSGPGFDLDSVAFKAILRADDWSLTDTDGRVIALRDLRLGIGTEALGAQVAAVLESLVTETSADGTRSVEQALDVSAKWTDALSAEPSWLVQCHDVPIGFSDALLGYDGVMVLWLGDVLDMDATVAMEQTTMGLGPSRRVFRYGLTSSSDRLGGRVEGMLDSGVLSLKTDANEAISAELSAEAFNWLMGMVSGSQEHPALTIDEAMPVFVTVNRGSYPSAAMRPGETIAYWPAEHFFIDAEIELSPATVYDPSRGYLYEMQSGTVTVRPGAEPGQFDFSFDLELWVPPDAGAEGVMALMRMEVNGFDVADTQGGIPRDLARLREVYGADGVLSLQNAPSALLDTLIGGEGGLAAALGPIVEDMDFRLNLRDGQPRGGTMRLNWDEETGAPVEGAHASMAPVDIAIDDAGMMRIADGQDVEIEMRVTEDLGDHWLGQLHPVLFDAKSADRPVRIVVDGASFRYPLWGPDMRGANIDAMIDLGSVQFGADSLLSHIVDWTGHNGEQAVFDPARVTVRDGEVRYTELALSVGNVRLQFDGAIDLVEQRVSEMAIRVPAESLVKVFQELEGVIELDDELVIPMTGPIRRPVVETQEFRAEVVRLLARRPRERLQREADRLIERVVGQVSEETGEEGAQVVENALRMLLGGRDD
ncbi:hypothetical protein OT109_14620 [Phycisphaeraceae bacterium D3-23]